MYMYRFEMERNTCTDSHTCYTCMMYLGIGFNFITIHISEKMQYVSRQQVLQNSV